MIALIVAVMESQHYGSVLDDDGREAGALNVEQHDADIESKVSIHLATFAWRYLPAPPQPHGCGSGSSTS